MMELREILSIDRSREARARHRVIVLTLAVVRIVHVVGALQL